MKISILICLVLTLTNCKPQNKEEKQTVEKIKHHKMDSKHEYNNLVNKDFEKFDITAFYKENSDGLAKKYKLPNEILIEESAGENGSWFIKNETQYKSLFTIYKEYYHNGNVKSKKLTFANGCPVGMEYEFDENRKLIKETDLDKPYKTNVEDIIEFLNNNEADFNSYLSVQRSYDEKTKKGTWQVDYRGKYKQTEGILMVTIDDQSSEIEQVIKITGKHGEKEIIFKK